MNNQDIKKEVLRRVRFVYFSRKFTQPIYLECFAIVALFAVVSYFVSIKNILINLSSVGVKNALFFTLSAFENTQVIVQIISCAALVVLVLLVKDILRVRPFVNAGI